MWVEVREKKWPESEVSRWSGEWDLRRKHQRDVKFEVMNFDFDMGRRRRRRMSHRRRRKSRRRRRNLFFCFFLSIKSSAGDSASLVNTMPQTTRRRFLSCCFSVNHLFSRVKPLHLYWSNIWVVILSLNQLLD